MDNTIPVDIALENYNKILKVKPNVLKSKYPFSAMGEEDVIKTLKRIELVYQNLTYDMSAYVRTDINNKNNKTSRWKNKRGGGGGTITIFTI
jgi:hypothetical protein